ncbi:hypothetical protein SADUNF_Sadunf04G0055400 [Salix dunnii]|uniref:Uncharacterized protein n=1 Tax=Salix dunnii TaxID=1413687 RepID=A0A835K654_9ROSI|nr:hypothetical protein SADUNF_Sadunf04G0055400 [Salix dunnii]
MVKREPVILQLIKILKYEHFAVFSFVLLSRLFFSFVSSSFFCSDEIARHYPDTLEQKTIIIIGIMKFGDNTIHEGATLWVFVHYCKDACIGSFLLAVD